MKYMIELADRSVSEATPIEGQWYAGITEMGQIGAVACYSNGAFENSSGIVHMQGYTVIRHVTHELVSAVVKQNNALDDKAKIQLALQWLETLIKTPAMGWNVKQKEAAMVALTEARAVV